MRRPLIAAALAAGLLAAACGGEEPAAPPEPGPTAVEPTTPAESAVPIEDAVAMRDEMLQIAEASAQADPGEALIVDFGVGGAWVEAFPGVSFSGSAIPPDPSTVSMYGNVQNSKNVEGEDNPYVVAAAVLDTEGTCAGLVLAGYPSLEEFLPVDDPSSCDPFTIAAEGGYETFG